MAGQAETIFALSSGQDRAGVAVVRISGPNAAHALQRLARALPAPRVATRARLIDPLDGAPLDDALVIIFPAPKSFTGEDVVELHLHGGRAVLAGVLAALGRTEGLRTAEPGEFTRRAFEHGKMDLTEAEGLADLINAETQSQRRLALTQMAGGLHRAAEVWRSDLLRAQALIEAAIDFSDEADVSERAVSDAAVLAAGVGLSLCEALNDDHKGEILRDGFRVVIAGPPNVGKSSLINAIAKRDAAIVSAEAGTTRDIVELQLNLGGIAIRIADTAGLRNAEGVIEREGIRRGLERANGADLLIWVVDATNPQPDLDPALVELEPFTLRIFNKIDLLNETTGFADEKYVRLSTATGVGLSLLEMKIAKLAQARTEGGDGALITAARHRAQIYAAAEALAVFERGRKSDLELRAEDLRQAAHAIGRLVGRVDVEEILGEIFGRFCIGK